MKAVVWAIRKKSTGELIGNRWNRYFNTAGGARTALRFLVRSWPYRPAEEAGADYELVSYRLEEISAKAF